MSARECVHDVLKGQEFCWCKYPQSMYPNWTPRQQKKSKIKKVIDSSRGRCLVYYVDVGSNGRFQSAGASRRVDAQDLDTLRAQWNFMMSEVSVLGYPIGG